MTENDLSVLFRSPTVIHAAKAGRTLPVGTDAKEHRATRALEIWLAIQTKVWLREKHAVSDPLVERVWCFSEGRSDIDMRVFIKGAYRKFKVKTEMTGPTAIRFEIMTWQAQGKLCKSWERYGRYYGNETKAGFETLPVR